jgi:DNA-binding transcriptional LysR family regulator
MSMSIFDRLEFKHLNSVVAIAEEGTFTAAAARIHLAQSALSRQIRELEDALKIRIFERDHGGSTLTPAGESLVRFARELLQTRIDVVKAVQAIHQTAMRPFRLGFTPFIEHEVIATVCDVYRDLFPKGSIQPENGDTDDVIDRLRRAELDAALVTLPLIPDGYCVQPVMHEPLVVCIRKDDLLAQLDELPAESLNGRLAIFSDPRHHPWAHTRLLEMLEGQGIKPKISNPTFNTEHVQWMVREHLCIALIRQSEPLHKELTTKPIRGVNWTIDSAIAYRQEHNQQALPLLLRNLEKRFSIAEPAPQKKPPRSVKEKQEQQHLFHDAQNGGLK